MVAGDEGRKTVTDEALSRQFEQTMRASCEEAAGLGYLPFVFLDRLQREGAVPYAKKLVRNPVLQSGFKRLAAMRRLDLSIEHLVVSDRFRGLFTKADVEAARGRLKLAMEGVETAPADDGEDALEPAAGASVEKRGAATPPPDEWDNALELAASELGDAMRHWRAAGLPPPVVGYELTDGAGEVVAEAELAWPAGRVAVLMRDGARCAPRFDRAGWVAHMGRAANIANVVGAALVRASGLG